jgi:hypothetical protein
MSQSTHGVSTATRRENMTHTATAPKRTPVVSAHATEHEKAPVRIDFYDLIGHLALERKRQRTANRPTK